MSIVTPVKTTSSPTIPFCGPDNHAFWESKTSNEIGLLEISSP